MASWDQQELSLQQCWLEVEAHESVWEEAEERRKNNNLIINSTLVMTAFEACKSNTVCD